MNITAYSTEESEFRYARCRHCYKVPQTSLSLSLFLYIYIVNYAVILESDFAVFLKNKNLKNTV
jgi:hypothetical protein